MRMDITSKQIEITHREEVIRSFNHRILRVAIGRKATDAELGVSNQQIVNYSTPMVRDIQCEELVVDAPCIDDLFLDRLNNLFVDTL